MANFRGKLLIYFVALSTSALLISNLAAVKLWDLFGIAVDGGIVVFPLLYIISDLIMEFYGEKVARHVVFAGFLINLIAMVVFYIVIFLPAYEGWDMQEAYASVLGFTPRIILASLFAYIFSNLVNNRLFAKMKQGDGLFASSFIARALGSSAFAHVVDSAIFETVAFLGVLSFPEFLKQAIFAYILGMGLEVLLSPCEHLIEKKLKGWMDDERIQEQ